MHEVDFYEKAGFKLFACNLNKTPAIPSWRSTDHHLSKEQAEKIMSRGHFIGAWLPIDHVVIDIDRNHKGKPDGMPEFQKLCTLLHVDPKDALNTMTVKTGSGGLHLYFRVPKDVDYKTLSQKSIATGVDVRTHLGYVIAAGTNGYTMTNSLKPALLPPALLKRIQTRNKDRANEYKPTKHVPIELLEKVLLKIDPKSFNTNDTWQEFVTSVIAAAGNSDAVLDLLENWSKRDEIYRDDPMVRRRIETFEPDGGITVGTFIHLIKQHAISKYMLDKVRVSIGEQFTFSDAFSDAYEPPFDVDYSIISDHEEAMGALYYTKHQTSGVSIFVALTKSRLLYSVDEKAFHYFNGHRWVETQGIFDVIFTVLLQAGQRFYTDKSKKRDNDADELITSYISFIGQIAIIQRLEMAIRQHPEIVQKAVPWDSPDIQGSLTLRDCVMDFSGKTVGFRQGFLTEYRKRYIDLTKKDFEDKSLPEKFRAFLKDVFPDDETRKTATYALATMLSGTGKFRKFQIWNGAGSNGKSTLMELMKHVIGERAISYRADLLLNKSQMQSLTPELAAFRGSLVAFSSETEESKRISQGAVKALTGNETLTANPKYQSVIEFKTTFQLVLSTNYLPTFSAHDAAFITRVLILPFYTCFYNTEEEKERAEAKGSRYFKPAVDITSLTDDIKKERAQILFYLAKRYQEMDNTIPESEECLQSKKHYVDDNNDIIQFIRDFVEYSDGEPWFTPTKDVVNFYNEENNTKYSSKFVIMRLREVYPLVSMQSKTIDGKLTRGIRGVRIKRAAYPEGYTGNFTEEELMEVVSL